MAIDPQLQKVVEYLVSTEETIAEKMRQDGSRPWINFSTLTKAGKFEFSKVHDIFTRESSNNEYNRLKTVPDAKSKDIQTSKLSADFLAGCERDYKMRTRSRVRTLIHATVTMAAANGNKKGPLRSNSIDWLSRILAETSQQQ